MKNTKNSDNLYIKNAHENNLKSIDVELPHNSLTVVTGLSGSGKTSFAFHTVYAEGQRRYIETFSPYTRQFFDKVKKPKADYLDNVKPSIAIQQKTRILNARSTVGSMTNVNNYLRILWANLSKPFCPKCDTELRSWNATEIVSWLKKERNSKSKYYFSSPVKSNKEELERYLVLGFSRYFDKKENKINSLEDIVPSKTKEIFLVLDRLSDASKIQEKNLSDTINKCFSMSGGKVVIFEIKDSKIFEHSFYNYLRCQSCDSKQTLEKLSKPKASLFSYNHPYGACAKCKGFGKVLEVDLELIIKNPSLSLRDGVISPWEGNKKSIFRRKLKAFCEENSIDMNSSWSKLSKTSKELILHSSTRKFTGVYPWFKKLERKAYKMHVRVFISKYRSEFECDICLGQRLKKEGLAFKIANKKISDTWDMEITALNSFLQDIYKDKKNKIPKKLKSPFKAIFERLEIIQNLGLNYLTLNRQARTLSGGETQRVNLAASLGSGLTSTQFVLDEPSVGLHPKDSDNLMKSIQKLKDKDNSILLVEHDPDCIKEADWILELGPESGSRGGEINYLGKPDKWKGASELFPKLIETKEVKPNNFIKIKNANIRNLKNLNIDIPLKRFVCLTGVSGSGKSTLIEEVIIKQKYSDSISGIEKFENILLVNQTPISKNPRGNIATYTKAWDQVRKLFSETTQAQELGLDKSSFSFNVDAGRCKACNGAGFIKEDLQFLSDVYINCDVCGGKRFGNTVLEVKVKGKNVFELLETSVDDVLELFAEDQKITKPLNVLKELGLGHLRIGHSLSELSGGEAQRLKLTPIISKNKYTESLIIFDEPTTGLHPKDISKLINIFVKLKKQGHSILCVEHNLQVIASSDWIINLGPGGGNEGGKLLGTGKPKDFIKKYAKTETAKYLNSYLKSSKTFKVSKKPKSYSSKFLTIKGARENNLKNFDIDLPLNKIVGFTGVSGSGKSTLAKDIIFSEGQKRYLDCLSPYARTFVKNIKKPEIDSIDNVQPSICVSQHTFQPSKLSTLGTLSEIYNFLRLLLTKGGEQYCPIHDSTKIETQTHKQIAKIISKFKTSNIKILANIVKEKKGYHKDIIGSAIRKEINEIRVDGGFTKSSFVADGLERHKAHTIDFVIANLNPQRTDVTLIEEAVKLALSFSNSEIIIHKNKKDEIYSTERSCPKCKKGYFKPDPEELSFNSKRGACSKCHGSGETTTGNTCSECNGTRLKSYALSIKLANKNIAELTQMNSSELYKFLKTVKLAKSRIEIVSPILLEIFSRLETLKDLGLDYIELDRDCRSISNGELQRLRLAAAIGSPLSGVNYIFDEPTAGLHPKDSSLIIDKIKELKNKNNTIYIIEHDENLIKACEHIIDIGPNGGEEGGEVLFNGSLEKFLKKGNTVTAKHLNEVDIPLIPKILTSKEKHTLNIKNGNKNNISKLNLKIPLNCLVTIAGVSGAGKSSLVHGIIGSNLIESKNKKKWKNKFGEISSSKDIERTIFVNQKPIGSNSRSNPASYLGIWQEIRKAFASTLEAKSLGWQSSQFSFNTGNGRCLECKGRGEIKLEMSLLENASMTCSTCQGQRFTEETNSIRFLDVSISDTLNLTFTQALKKFTNHRKIYQTLKTAVDLGLGYLRLGQASSTLSGGESQRIKLVSELNSSRKGHTLYILDEPTTGLHKEDVFKLIKVFRELINSGNSIFVIEHDKDLIFNSDYIIEIGPEAGENGGQVIYKGSLEKIKNSKTPWGKILSKSKKAK